MKHATSRHAFRGPGLSDLYKKPHPVLDALELGHLATVAHRPHVQDDVFERLGPLARLARQEEARRGHHLRAVCSHEGGQVRGQPVPLFAWLLLLQQHEVCVCPQAWTCVRGSEHELEKQKPTHPGVIGAHGPRCIEVVAEDCRGGDRRDWAAQAEGTAALSNASAIHGLLHMENLQPSALYCRRVG